MAQQPIELILLKQWAEHMASPVWLLDVEGLLVYSNEPAESLLGLRFDQAGEITAHDLSDLFQTASLEGSPLAASDLPVVIALTKRVPHHAQLSIQNRSGELKHIEVTALPLVAADGELLGAIAIFWETVG